MNFRDQAPLFTDHLTGSENLAPVNRTHIGQAHFAGTGPKGKTCRECVKWQIVGQDGFSQDHRYSGGKRRGWLALLFAKCTHALLNKADRLIPPYAEACRFFEQSDAPPPSEWKRDGRFKKGGAE